MIISQIIVTSTKKDNQNDLPEKILSTKKLFGRPFENA